MARILVIQPLPGIGDMVWHLPFLHALACSAAEPVHVLCKPCSAAPQLLKHDPAIADIHFIHRPGQHAGFRGLIRLARQIRQINPEQIWLLHDSTRYLLAARLAGVRTVYSYTAKSLGRQLSSQPHYPQPRTHHPFDKAMALLQAHQIKVADTQPRLLIPETLKTTLTERYQAYPRPWLCVGLGASESYKQWGAERFSALLDLFEKATGGTVFLLGARTETNLAAHIHQAKPQQRLVLLNQPLDEVAALIAISHLFVGNDTGVLNMAGAMDVRCIGLFAASPPLHFFPKLIACTPIDGRIEKRDPDVMQKITASQVWAILAPLCQP